MKLTSKQFIPLYFHGIIGLYIFGSALVSRTVPYFNITALLLAGLVCWWFFEYAVHRFFMHHLDAEGRPDRPGSTTHHAHHADPRSLEGLTVSLKFSIPVAASCLLAGRIIFGNSQEMAFFYTGYLSGYFAYEILHYQAHHGCPRFRVLQYLRTYHLLHHQRPDRRLMITLPFFEKMFGTYDVVPKRKIRPSAKGLRPLPVRGKPQISF